MCGKFDNKKISLLQKKLSTVEKKQNNVSLPIKKKNGANSSVSVLGEQFSSVPPCFSSALSELEPLGRVARWGFLEDKAEYWEALREADVVVSTGRERT